MLRREAFYGDQDIGWFDPQGASPDWLDPNQRQLACLVRGREGPDLYLMFNAGTDSVSFILPVLTPSRQWKLAIDTARPSLATTDVANQDGAIVTEPICTVGPRSSAVAEAVTSM